MPSHKTLQSVAYSIAHALTSPYHYADGDFIIGHILKSALKSGDEDLVIDILSGTASPPTLAPALVIKFIERYRAQFPTLVQRNKSTMDFVEKAILSVNFDLTEKKVLANSGSDVFYKVPYSCVACIQDNRGKQYCFTFSDLCYQEPPPPLMTRTERIVNAAKRMRCKFLYRVRNLFPKKD